MTLPVAPTRGRTAFGLGGAVLLLVGTAVAVPAATLPVVGLVAALLAVPLLRALAEGAAWSLPLLVSVVVLLADVGGRTIGSGPWRYVATVAVVLTIVLVGMRPDARSRALRITAAVLFLYGLLGTLYGRTVLGTANGALPLVGPLLIACLPAVRDWGAVPRWRLGLRVVAGAGAVFALFSALSRLGFLPADQADVVNHEKAFLVVLAVAAALAARDLRLVLVAAGAAVFAFATYPAATYLVAAAAAVGTVVLARWSPGATARVWLAAASMAATAWAVLRIDDLLALAGTYFELVGKTNNSGTRRALYEEALQGLENPLVGSLFTGDITVVGTLSGQDRVVPVHNDYLSITLGGGLLAAALLLGLFLYANGLALRSLREMTDPEQRRTVIALLSGVNAAAVSAFANPIFMNPGASALAYAMLAALVAACRVPAAAPPDDGR